MLSVSAFSAHHPLNILPHEDRFAVAHENRLIVVADGITRDPRNMPRIPYGTVGLDSAQSWRDYPNPIAMVPFILKYPRPSPAALASQVFCDTVVACFSDNTPVPPPVPPIRRMGASPVSPDRMRDAVARGNAAVGTLNRAHNPEPDFLENDYWACVASAVWIEPGDEIARVTYAFIGDCGVVLFSRDGTEVFRTPNDVSSDILPDIAEKYGLAFEDAEGRRITRRDYRNRPDQPLSFGAITGQPEAMQYLHTGQLDMHRDQALMVYSDGCEDFIYSEKAAALIRGGDWRRFARACRRAIRTEGTLAIATVES